MGYDGVVMASLRIGTCSWKYPSWKGHVYSRASGIDYLEEYARQYDTVEIDQWFWSLFGESKVSLPKPETAAGYVDSVGSDFTFTVKVPNSITLTHFYKSAGFRDDRPNPYFLSVSLFEDFLAALGPMVPRVRAFMFQFEYLNRSKMPSLGAFLEKIADFFDRAPAGLPYSMEPRNPAWLDRTYFEFIRERGLSHVFLQGYYMPDIREVYRRNGELVRGSSVIRLHGNDREGIEERTGKRYDRIVDDRADELPGVAEMVKDLIRRGVNVFLNVNNHYEGSAPLTIRRIREYL